MKGTVIRCWRQWLHFLRLQNQMEEAGWHTQENGANVPPSARRVLREIQDSINGWTSLYLVHRIVPKVWRRGKGEREQYRFLELSFLHLSYVVTLLVLGRQYWWLAIRNSDLLICQNYNRTMTDKTKSWLNQKLKLLILACRPESLIWICWNK